jgi:hypothetical protein
MYKCHTCTYLQQCHSLQNLAHQKGLHPEDLMRASSPVARGQRKQRSLFEWKNGEIVRVTDEKRLLRAEKLRYKPTQLSFFFGQEEQQELQEEAESSQTGNYTESIATNEDWQPEGHDAPGRDWDEVQAS